MKKITFVIFTLILFLSCSNNEIEEKCKNVDLGITKEAQYYSDNGNRMKWKWKRETSERYGLLLTLSASFEDSNGSTNRDLVFILKDNKCPVLLLNTYEHKPYNCNDCDAVYDKYSTNNLRLQKWIKDKIIIGKVENTTFWVELNKENEDI